MNCPKPVILPKNILAPNTSNISNAMRIAQILKTQRGGQLKK
jgi:hypothetical protein